MNRHVIIGRFGPGDRVTVPTAIDEVATNLDLISSNKRLDHGIGRALDDLVKIDIFPSEIGLDLLILAAHVHAADTRISRKTESQDSWTREMRLVVPVSEPQRWSSTIPILQRMLNFLTGDRWLIGFRARPESFNSIAPAKPEASAKSPFDQISLFSGGLDSLIGALDLLEGGRIPLFVSHAGEGATSNAQEVLFTTLKKHYNTQPYNRLRLWMNFPNGLVRHVASEDTTRGRSFLFFSAGVFVGTGFPGPFKLNVPENGLIALNVPLDSLRLGSLSTRTTHPFYMSCWNELLGILQISGQVENPYWSQTKGEMVVACAQKSLLAKLIPDSLSCSSPTKGRWRGHGIEHCGYCLPCLIRRAAIKKGLTSDPTKYTISDLSAQILDSHKAEGQQVRSFQLAISRLQNYPEIASLLIHKAGPLLDQTEPQKKSLAEVYSRGLQEVSTILANVKTKPS